MIFNSKVSGHEGLCKPTWLNRNNMHTRIDGGYTGFFRNVKKKFGIYWKIGKEFHGIIKSDGSVLSTVKYSDIDY